MANVASASLAYTTEGDTKDGASTSGVASEYDETPNDKSALWNCVAHAVFLPDQLQITPSVSPRLAQLDRITPMSKAYFRTPDARASDMGGRLVRISLCVGRHDLYVGWLRKSKCKSDRSFSALEDSISPSSTAEDEASQPSTDFCDGPANTDAEIPENRAGRPGWPDSLTFCTGEMARLVDVSEVRTVTERIPRRRAQIFIGLAPKSYAAGPARQITTRSN